MWVSGCFDDVIFKSGMGGLIFENLYFTKLMFAFNILYWEILFKNLRTDIRKVKQYMYYNF